MPEAQDKAYDQYKSSVYTSDRAELTHILLAAIHHNFLFNYLPEELYMSANSVIVLSARKEIISHPR